MGKKVSLGTSLTVVIIAIAITFSLTMVFALRNFNEKVSSITERENMFAKFTEIDNYVRQNQQENIDENRLMDSVAEGYLNGIDDPYAFYMNAEDYAAYISASKDTVAGVGLNTTMDSDGYMLVGKVLEGSTAASAGILPGDLITKVDDIKLSIDTYSEAQALLTGEAGTKVTLTVRRDSEDTEMEITRRVLTASTISTTKFGDYAYIRIDNFTESTPDQFNRALENAISSGSTALIFDVRSVDEGLASSAATILDKLIGSGDLLYVKYQDGADTLLYSSNSRETDLPMVVLVNESTSGAAEFFAGVLKDYEKAKLVGTQTAGVGSLQKNFKLDDGSAIQLTVGRYYLPHSHDFWEGKGILPDHTCSLNYTPDFTDISLLDAGVDTQLAKAIEIASSSVVAENKEASEKAENNE